MSDRRGWQAVGWLTFIVFVVWLAWMAVEWTH